ncbi:MAG: helix-turn-helix domain-containing protein [Salinirussus sp.]
MTEEIPPEDDGRLGYDPSSSRYDLFECAHCDNIILALGRDDPPMSCHGNPMERVTDCEISVVPPEIERVLLQAFGLPKPSIEICRCVSKNGPVSSAEVAEKLEYDRSTTTRYLNTLVDLGLISRSEANRDSGGIVNLYYPIEIEELRRETLLGFYVWAGEAAARIEEMNRTKRQYLEENSNYDRSDADPMSVWEWASR